MKIEYKFYTSSLIRQIQQEESIKQQYNTLSIHEKMDWNNYIYHLAQNVIECYEKIDKKIDPNLYMRYENAITIATSIAQQLPADLIAEVQNTIYGSISLQAPYLIIKHAGINEITRLLNQLSLLADSICVQKIYKQLEFPVTESGNIYYNSEWIELSFGFKLVKSDSPNAPTKSFPNNQNHQ